MFNTNNQKNMLPSKAKYMKVYDLPSFMLNIGSIVRIHLVTIMEIKVNICIQLAFKLLAQQLPRGIAYVVQKVYCVNWASIE